VATGCEESLWVEMKNRYRARVLLASVLLVSCVTAAYAKDDARSLYDHANTLEEKLRSTAAQKELSQWKKTVEAFRKVYYNFPTSPYSDNSLFHVGALYAEMAGRFNDNIYYHRACSTYEFLINEYSSSSLVDEAMLEYIRIMRDELNNEDEAGSMEAKLRKVSPKAAEALAKAAPPKTTGNPDSEDCANLENLRYYTGTDYTRIVLDFSKEVSFKRNRLSDPDRLYFDFEDATAPGSMLRENYMVDDGFLKQIRVGQNTDNRVRVVLDLKNIQNYEVFSLYHPFRVVIDVQGKKGVVIPEIAAAPETPPAPLSPPEMAQANTSGQYSLARQLGLRVGKIIVDPGHGGYDPGAMHHGLQEKDITLDVSQRLKKILESDYGYEVLMTRNDDHFVALEERTAIANSNSADLFVSVHVNSSRNRKANGVETYYLNFATTPEAMEVAARENAISEKNMGELQKLTTAIALNSKIEESRDFAGLIQTNLVTHLNKQYPVTNLGVKKAPFYVLIGAQMPAILAEISFVSNEHDSGMLEKSSYRQSIAEGLAKGVKNYIETLAESQLTQNISRKATEK
jgi:N-acetylmuramoyl-L-alanine amidase